jgi:hypothetical protein
MTETTFKGGCLCGALRWEASSRAGLYGHVLLRRLPQGVGVGVHPVHGLYGRGADHHRAGAPVPQPIVPKYGEATRNSCPTCGGLVFGGEHGLHDSHTIYAGSLDDPSLFKPAMLLFNRDRPPG